MGFRNTFKEAREATGLARLKRLFWQKFLKPSPLRSAAGMVARQFPGGAPPDWAAAQEREFWLNQNARSGFIGGLNYYRNFDANFTATAKLEGATVQQPAGFLYGSDDMVIRGMVQETWLEDMRAFAPKMHTSLACPRVPIGSCWRSQMP